jgi:HAD superfamily hydrolase (TIGR01450 family)
VNAKRRRLPGLLIDLDGTVCLGEDLIDGAAEAIGEVRRRGHPLVFASNTLEHASVFAARLTRQGIPTRPGEILHVPFVLCHYLRQHAPGAAVFAIGETSLIEQLAPEFHISRDPEVIDVVVASSDLAFDFNKLNTAFQALRRGARFVATNLDPTWPGPNGELPDTGAVIGALEGSTGRRVEAVVGKPSALFAEAALERLGVTAPQAWVVGDSLTSDIAMGRELGMTTVAVLTGVTHPADLAASPMQPDHVIESIADLPALLVSHSGNRD